MATRYVDKLGTDSGAGTSPGASAWLTMVFAEENATTADTIEVNAGTYVEEDATFGGLDSAKALTWNATGTVIVQANPATNHNHVLLFRTSTVASFTGFTLDAGGTNSDLGIIRLASSAANKTFTGGTIKNTETAGYIYSGSTGSNLVITNNTISSVKAVGIVFDFRNMTGDLTVTGNTLDGTGGAYRLILTSDSSTTGDIIFSNNSGTIVTAGSSSKIAMNASSGAVTINDNNFTVSSGSALTNFIDVNKSTDLEIDNNTIDTSASGDTAHVSIYVRASTSGSHTAPHITNNTCSSSTNTGQVILVGSDTTASSVAGELNDAVITGNIVTSTGTPHGIEYGYNKNGIVEGNYVHDVALGIVMKGTEDWASLRGCNGNLIVDCSDACILVKGFKKLNVCNTTLVATSAQLTVTRGLLGIIDNNTSADSPSNDCNAYGNIFYTTTTAISLVDCEHTASASGLDVDYSLMDSGSGDTVTNIVVAATYTVFAAAGGWQATAGQDASGTQETPGFVDEVDFELTASDGNGFKWWANAPRPLGNNGEPFPDTQIDRGCNQKV